MDILNCKIEWGYVGVLAGIAIGFKIYTSIKKFIAKPKKYVEMDSNGPVSFIGKRISQKCNKNNLNRLAVYLTTSNKYIGVIDLKYIQNDSQIQKLITTTNFKELKNFFSQVHDSHSAKEKLMKDPKLSHIFCEEIT